MASAAKKPTVKTSKAEPRKAPVQKSTSKPAAKVAKPVPSKAAPARKASPQVAAAKAKPAAAKTRPETGKTAVAKTTAKAQAAKPSTAGKIAPVPARPAAAKTPSAKPAVKAAPTKKAAAAKAAAKPAPIAPKSGKTIPVKSKSATPAPAKAAPAPKAAAKTAAAKAKPAPAKKPSGQVLTDEDILAMPEEDYMNEVQLNFFKARLQAMKEEILDNARETGEHLKENEVFADPNDRATVEEENMLEQRVRDRERKLLKKIDQALARIESGEYGYCLETGEPIGIARLLARPTAELSIEAQEKHERRERLFAD